MDLRRIGAWLRVLSTIALLLACGIAAAAEHRGQVVFNGVPIPGATVTLSQGDKKFSTVTDQQGVYSFSDVPDGSWKIEIKMLGFSTMEGDVVVERSAPPPPPWNLTMQALDDIKAEVETVAPASVADTATATTAAPPAPGEKKTGATPVQPGQTAAAKPAEAESAPEETDQRAADGFLINGSNNNGAASPFAQLAAFGNNRNFGKGLYNGGFGAIINNSALNARPFALSGLTSPKPSYNQITGVFNLGGPLRIPHLLKNGPVFFVGYQWTRNGTDTTQTALVPTLLERAGDFSQSVNGLGQPLQIFDPATGQPFTGNTVPISAQAQSLLKLYPTPNVSGTPRYNFQTPIVSNLHQDALQSRFTKTFNRRDSMNGTFGFQSTRISAPNLFNFLDKSTSLGMNTNVNWTHRYGQHWLQTLGFRYSRQASRNIPFWADVANISGLAGITGNNQDPVNWGPPSLTFLSSGTIGLGDGNSSHNRNQTSAVSYSMLWNHRSHNVTFGGDYRRQEFNYLSQQDPRGGFTFTGAATQRVVNGVAQGGSDLADFLLGIPDTSSISFGNADKYFRQSVYDVFINDDWRVNPGLTVNGGIRWDYGAPITELFGRLVNLDIAPGFGAIAPVVGTNPEGAVTGQAYPNSLVRPDKMGFGPRIGISWRPISGSSIVVRAGYALNYDTSVYQSIALQMAQQAPLSTSSRVQNSAACPLTLANGFNTCPSVTPDSFAIDPNFKVGYVQTWQISVQRDLPWSLQMTATYLGIKGTRGAQEFLPNTFPAGAINPCPLCPAGYAFLTSNGNSSKEAGQLQLRRRLRAGLTATMQYTYSKAIDDDSSLGGQLTTNPILAQNWLNLRAERGLSTFDQRHLLTGNVQYTTGMGLGGKTLMSGWRSTLYKEWTVINQVSVGSGTPQTPIFPGAVTGTGFSASLRPDVTGAPLYAAPA